MKGDMKSVIVGQNGVYHQLPAKWLADTNMLYFDWFNFL